MRDVPKERWVAYPGAELEGDPSPVISWAGWNHRQQAQALAEYYITDNDTLDQEVLVISNCDLEDQGRDSPSCASEAVLAATAHWMPDRLIA